MLNLDAQTKRKAIWLGAMLAPVLSVQIVRMLDGPGPASAPAAPPETLTPDQAQLAGAAPPVKPLSEAQNRAIAYLARFEPPANLRSPMDAPERPLSPPAPPSVPPKPSDAPVEPTPKVADPLAGLVVSAIVGSGDASMAMISRQLRRSGDEVAPGWRIVEIDSRGRRVVLSGPDARTVVLTPPAPGE